MLRFPDYNCVMLPRHLKPNSIRSCSACLGGTVILQCPQFPATVKVIMDVANQCEHSETKRDDREPERKGVESAQNPEYNRRNKKESKMNGYRPPREPPVPLQLFDFFFRVHTEMRERSLKNPCNSWVWGGSHSKLPTLVR